MEVTMLVRRNATQVALLLAIISRAFTPALAAAEDKEDAVVPVSYVADVSAKPSPKQIGKQHPLTPVLQYATRGLQAIEQDVRDYSCVMVARQRQQGKLSNYQYMEAKVRHAQDNDGKQTPFSIYMKFQRPSDISGREVLFVDGERNGDMLVRNGGKRLPNLTLQLDPHSERVLQESRYPITDMGIKNMVMRLIEVVEDEMDTDDCEVKLFENAKMNGRSCTHIMVTHRTRQADSRFHMARVLVDNELQVPVYVASYSWPTSKGGKPVLMEELAFTELKLNVGLSDADFSSTNPSYGFKKQEEVATR
jgi:hypothetical protein